MVRLDHSDTIKAPVDRVFAYVTDFRRAAEWQDGVIESTQTPEGETRVGTQAKMVRTLLGQRIEGTGEVIEYEVNRKFAFRSTSGPVQFRLVQAFTSEGAGTRVDTHMEMEAAGFLKVAEGMIAGTMKQQMQEQANKLKLILES